MSLLILFQNIRATSTPKVLELHSLVLNVNQMEQLAGMRNAIQYTGPELRLVKN